MNSLQAGMSWVLIPCLVIVAAVIIYRRAPLLRGPCMIDRYVPKTACRKPQTIAGRAIFQPTPPASALPVLSGEYHHWSGELRLLGFSAGCVGASATEKRSGVNRGSWICLQKYENGGKKMLWMTIQEVNVQVKRRIRVLHTAVILKSISERLKAPFLMGNGHIILQYLVSFPAFFCN